jgi:hypothetical protein
LLNILSNLGKDISGYAPLGLEGRSYRNDGSKATANQEFAHTLIEASVCINKKYDDIVQRGQATELSGAVTDAITGD